MVMMMSMLLIIVKSWNTFIEDHFDEGGDEAT
jgi:hypothetical protein